MIRTLKLLALLATVLLTGTALVRAGDDKVLSKEEFLAKVIDCNVTETDLADKAVKNAQSEDVRKYAQRLVKDHTANKDKAVDLAKDLKIGVVTGLSAEHKEAMAKLLLATGKDFDRKFIQHMVRSHKKAVKMLEANAKGSASEQVRAFAKNALPAIREHLDMARKLDKQLNP